MSYSTFIFDVAVSVEGRFAVPIPRVTQAGSPDDATTPHYYALHFISSHVIASILRHHCLLLQDITYITTLD